MATVPTFSTIGANSQAQSSWANHDVRDAGQFWVSNRPMALLRATSTQSLTNGTWTSINFDTEDLDRDSGHSTSSNTSRYTAQTAGWYWVAGLVTFANNNVGARGARIAVNGSALAASQSLAQTPATTANPGILVGRLVFLAVNDFVEIQGFQASGGALNTQATADGAPNMSVIWEGS